MKGSRAEGRPANKQLQRYRAVAELGRYIINKFSEVAV